MAPHTTTPDTTTPSIGRPVHTQVVSGFGDGYMPDYYTYRKFEAAPIGTANAVESHLGGDVHVPVLDIDLPVQVLASKTPGHHHLLIDAPMSWRKYRRLLRALARAGIVEKEWARATIASRRTWVYLR